MQNKLIKENLFKIKKIIMHEKDYRGNTLDTKEVIGILMPAFIPAINEFSTHSSKIIDLDGKVFIVQNDDIEIEDTRIELNPEIKESLNELVEWAKDKYELEKESIILYKEYEEKKKLYENKIMEMKDNRDNLLYTFEKLKKAQNLLLPYNEIMDELDGVVNSIINKEPKLEYYRRCPKSYWIDIDKNKHEQVLIVFEGETIVFIDYLKDAYIDKNTCDFIVENNKYLESNKNFQIFKNENFETIDEYKLESIGGMQEFLQSYGSHSDKVRMCHRVRLNINLECSIKNIEEVKRRFKSLLKMLNY